MRRPIITIASVAIATLILLVAGCEKEKLVESTEYVHDIEYVELPGDTIYRVDTVVSLDSIAINNTDTVTVSDTVIQLDYIFDTVVVYDTTVTVEHHYDTVVTVENHYDTIVTVEDHYDTVAVTDTVQITQCDPNEHFAFAALQYHCDPVVIQIINQEFGYTDGWVFYLSAFQIALTEQSSDVYDIYGYIDYWTPDWSGFYAFEFYWRMTFTGGDPADMDNWQMAEPPVALTNYQPGVRLAPEGAASQRTLR